MARTRSRRVAKTSANRACRWRATSSSVYGAKSAGTSIVCVPLQTGGRVLGVISLMNCAQESFDEHEMLFLHALCGYAAIAVDYKRS